MQNFLDALIEGFKEQFVAGSYVFYFGENMEYELCFERLIFDNQYYVALYKDGALLTNKVVVKPGK